MATILYGRVSTDEQTVEHQLTQAEAAGFKFDMPPIWDEGVSGVNTRLAERPNGRRLFDILRAGDTLVVRWLDRLGRNYEDVCETIKEFMRRGVVIRTVINGLTFDGATTDPMQKAVRDALIGFMAATAQAQAEASKIAQKAGIAHAKNGGGFRGRKPDYTLEQFEEIRAMLEREMPITSIADSVGVSRQTVYRIKSDPAACHANLVAWSKIKPKKARRERNRFKFDGGEVHPA